MNESIHQRIEFRLWDGRNVRNFTGNSAIGILELKDTCFSVYASCDSERFDEVTELWYPCHYLWKGEYKKIATVGVELFAKLGGKYQLHISVTGVSGDVVIVFDSFKEANDFYKVIKNWLGWQ